MNKKRNIIRILLILILLAAPFSVFYLINQSKTINPITNTTNSSTSYYIEPGLEDISQQIKEAVENYLNQSNSESNSARKIRLGLYFSIKSPVYSYEAKNTSSLVNKTTAKILSIESSNAEGEYPNYLVNVNVIFYSGSKTEVKNQNYWISMTKLSDGSKIPYDIGEL